MESDDLSTSAEVHLCVVIHGLWGTPAHVDHIAQSLRDEYPDSSLHIIQPKSNSGNFTYDGIETGAERVTKEMEDEIEELEKIGKIVKKLSMVGYSMGGLIARYVIGILYSKGIFEKIEPMNFTTFASPHLGTRSPVAGWRSQLFNSLASRTLSQSGRQMWMTDTFRDTGRPILSLLADPTSIFIRALSAFKNRVLYANIVRDRSVPYYTAFITQTDPYVDLDKVDINYLPDTDDRILDPARPTTFKDKPLSTYEYMSSMGNNIALNIPMVFFMTVLAPIGATAFLINAGVQSFQSAQRIKLHQEGKGGSGLGAYRIPMMLENLQLQAGGALKEDYLTESDAAQLGTGTSSDQDELTPLSSTSEIKSSNGVDRQNSPVRTDGKENNEVITDALGFPILALTAEQFEMAASLNRVGFTKYGVHIKNVNHSHAAIIMRSNLQRLAEGKIICKHWAERFEV